MNQRSLAFITLLNTFKYRVVEVVDSNYVDYEGAEVKSVAIRPGGNLVVYLTDGRFFTVYDPHVGEVSFQGRMEVLGAGFMVELLFHLEPVEVDERLSTRLTQLTNIHGGTAPDPNRPR